MNNYSVYIHKNKINGKVYVGLTKQKPENRWRFGMGYKTQPKFFRAILKYGWDNFEHIIIYTGLTEYEASKKEKELIIKYDSYNNGYNADLGGSTTNHSPATLEKMRQSMTGKKHTQETKNKISQSKNQYKISVICLTTGKTYNSIKEASEQTGVDQSSIIKCCKGVVMTAGKMKWRYADSILNEQYISLINNKDEKHKFGRKPVICITTGKYYDSVAAAAADTKSDASNIIKVCNGKYKTTNKLQWKYAE